MSANGTFLREARRSDQALAACVRVYLAEPSTRTLKLSTLGFDTPDGSTWESCITEFDDIVAPGSPLSPGPDLCSGGFKIASRAALGFQADGDNITNLFADFRWYGAPVEIFIWPFRSTDPTDLTRVFAGVVGSYKVGPDVCEVHLVQRSDWDRQISPVIVQRDKYPRAPDRSVGLPLSVVYGTIGLPARSPWTSSDLLNIEKANGGGQLAVPAVTVDTGRGAGNQRQRVLVASHPLYDHSDSALGLSYYLDAEEKLVQVTPTALINASDGAGFELGDDFGSAFYPIKMVETFPGAAGGALNLPYSIDPNSEGTFSRTDTALASGTPRTVQSWRAESVSPPGVLVEAFLVVGYVFSPGGWSVGPTAVMQCATAGGTKTIVVTGNTSVSVQRTSIGTAWGAAGMPSVPWDFSECQWDAAWTSAFPTPAQRWDIFFLGIDVQYKPQAKVYAPASVGKPRLRRAEPNGRAGLPLVFQPGAVSPPDTEIESVFYGTVMGYADDGSGTYTGLAGGIIEVSPDVGRHMLRTYGGQSAAQIETGVGVHGSFVDARQYQANWRVRPMRLGLFGSDRTSVQEQLVAIAQSSLSMFIIDRFSDRFLAVPWFPGAGSSYARQVYRDDLREFPDIEPIDTKRVPSGITIRYAYDGKSRQTICSTTCATDSSTAGYLYLGLRDQSLQILSEVNDRLEILVSGTTYTKQFAQGDYDDTGFLTQAQTANTAVSPLSVALGGLIVASVNDRIAVTVGGVLKLTTIPAGRYSMEGLATAAQTALNSVSSGWTVTYDRSTQKFTFAHAATCTMEWADGDSIPTNAQHAAAVFGFKNGTRSGSTSYVSDFPMDECRFGISCSTTIGLMFQTGTFGSEAATPKTCAGVLGFDARQDRTGATGYSSDCYLGFREKLLQAGGDSYGYTRDLVIEARAIYDTDTALELRNRYVDWLREPRLSLTFTTWKMPDVQRGQLIRLDDLDYSGVAYPKRGSDGLWAGKTFRVVSVRQKLGNNFDQEITCVENDILPITSAPTPGLGDYGSITVGGEVWVGDILVPTP